MSQLDEYSDLGFSDSVQIAKLGFGGRVLSRMVGNIAFGSLTIVLPSGTTIVKQGLAAGPEATIVMRRWRALRRILLAGDIGLADGYIEQDWETPDLTALIRFGARNREQLSPAIEGSLIMRAADRIGHLLKANTRKGSRRNIEAHYDLGNEFYAKWLDASMLYSSAIYDETTQSLEAAQARRLAVICDRLDLSEGKSVLEIGCGWGSLAIALAARSQGNVVGLTLSPSQLAWARSAVKIAGYDGQVDLQLRDYRDVDGQFDRIVSIEMFEAVGEAYWPVYFDTVKKCLAADGRAVLQIISIEDGRFESYRDDVDFIQKYIFPGGFLPSDKALEAAIGAAGLKLVVREHFGQSYARTLHDWRVRFEAQWPAIAALGFDDRFRRLWRYYLCYCEAGFREDCINVGLYTIEHA